MLARSDRLATGSWNLPSIDVQMGEDIGLGHQRFETPGGQIMLCRFSVFVTSILVITSLARAQDRPYSPYVGQDFPNNVYFGDTHLHTNISFDAYGDGNINLDSDDAYRFAKGEQLEGHDGQPVRMSRPLDFLVIADHAEYLGVVQGVADGNELLTSTEAGARWSEIAQKVRWPPPGFWRNGQRRGH